MKLARWVVPWVGGGGGGSPPLKINNESLRHLLGGWSCRDWFFFFQRGGRPGTPGVAKGAGPALCRSADGAMGMQTNTLRVTPPPLPPSPLPPPSLAQVLGLMNLAKHEYPELASGAASPGGLEALAYVLGLMPAYADNEAIQVAGC